MLTQSKVKKHMTLLLLLLAECVAADAATSVTYRLVHRSSRENNRLITDHALLYIQENGSLFIDRKSIRRKSASERNIPNHAKAGLLASIGMPYLKFYIKKHYRENHLHYIEEHHHAVEIPTPNRWRLTQKDSVIRGMNVHQAEGSFGNRKWTVWFTLEVPISDGPYLFSGLPGLVLKANDNQGDFDFEVIGIERDVPENSLPKVPTYTLIPEKKFRAIREQMANDPFAQIRSNGGTIQGDVTINGKKNVSRRILAPPQKRK